MGLAGEEEGGEETARGLISPRNPSATGGKKDRGRLAYACASKLAARLTPGFGSILEKLCMRKIFFCSIGAEEIFSRRGDKCGIV